MDIITYTINNEETMPVSPDNHGIVSQSWNVLERTSSLELGATLRPGTISNPPNHFSVFPSTKSLQTIHA